MADLCLAVKKKGSTARCPKKARPGSQFCGVHARAKKPTLWAGQENDAKSGAPVENDAKACAPKKEAHPSYVNEEDLCTCRQVAKIPAKELYVLQEGGLRYAFEVGTFSTLLDSGTTSNPYTNQPIPLATIEAFRESLKGRQVPKPKPPKLTKKQKLRDHVYRLFQKIDMLDNYTNPEWFLNMSRSQLRNYYLHMQDIWYYRAGLSEDQRTRMVPSGQIFECTLSQLKVLNQRELQYLVMHDMERLITEGLDENERKLGAIYLLSGLVMVSPQAYNALPQFHQVF